MSQKIPANMACGQLQVKCNALLQVCQPWLDSIGKITYTNTEIYSALGTIDKFL